MPESRGLRSILALSVIFTAEEVRTLDRLVEELAPDSILRHKEGFMMDLRGDVALDFTQVKGPYRRKLDRVTCARFIVVLSRENEDLSNRMKEKQGEWKNIFSNYYKKLNATDKD